MKTLPKKLLLLLLISCTFLPLSAQKEVINNFQTTLTVQPDGMAQVEEIIDVSTAGKRIKRGITRAITRNPIGGGHQSQFNYRVASVERDGRPIDYFEERGGYLHTFYLGSKSKKLPPGNYVYKFNYYGFDQVYKTDTYEEVRWHLVDTESSLPTTNASMTVYFPEGMTVMAATCYAGEAGSSDQYCTTVFTNNEATFTLSRPLEPGEGMTVAAGVAPGAFAHLNSTTATPEMTGVNGLLSTGSTSSPDFGDVSVGDPTAERSLPAPTNRNALYAIVFGLLAAFMYAYTTWRKHGVDPKVTVDDYQFYPPEGLSPAEVSGIHNMQGSQLPIIASLTELAVAGHIKVEERTSKGFLGMGKEDYYVLHQTQTHPLVDQVGAPAYALYIKLFEKTATIELDGEYNRRLKKAGREHDKALDLQLKAHRKDGANGRFVWPLAGILLASIGLAVYFLPGGGKPALIALVVGVIASSIMLFTYAHLIRQPSTNKVRLIANIKAFKRYLNLSKHDRDTTRNAPDMTREYYDQVLPYAVGLGVDNDWAANLMHDWLGTSGRRSEEEDHGGFVYYMPGFGKQFRQSYQSSSTDSSSSSSFSGGGGSVGGGGGGTGGF